LPIYAPLVTKGARVRILLVEDDESLGSVLLHALTEHGHAVSWCRSALDALRSHHNRDFILLDTDIPDSNGIEVLRRLRRVCEAPMVTLTSQGDERSVVRGLRSGADDCIVKPIRVRETLARVDAVARRSSYHRKGQKRVVELRDVAVDLEARAVLVGGQGIELTTKEFEVLAVLARRAGAAVSRQQILDEVWGDAYLAVSRSLDVHLTSLRAKINRPGLLQTVRGFGYRLG
jgi:DNA-binding response OmpR family regulator